NAGQLITVDSITNANTDALGGTMFAGGTVTIAAPADENTAINLTGISVGGVSLDNITVAGSGTTAAATQTSAANALVTAINAGSAQLGVVAELDGTTAGQINVASFMEGSTAIPLSVGAGATAASSAPTAETFVGDVDISTFAGAQQAIAIMDNALSSVNDARADLGAIQNRFSSVVANLQTTSENLSASRSRIMDTDFAKETAE